MSIRILLVDDNHLFRKGVAALLSSQPDMSVVGDLHGSKEAVQAALRLEPEVIMMEILQAGVCGLDTVAQIKERLPHILVILLTSVRTRDYVRAALRVGANGYVLKDASFEELLMAVRSVAAGKLYLSPDVSCFLVEGLLHPERSQARSSKLEWLNSRERSILQLVAEGRTNRSAAEYLNLSPKTIEKYRASLMGKLGLRNATELKLAAMELGLIARPTSHWKIDDEHAQFYADFKAPSSSPQSQLAAKEQDPGPVVAEVAESPAVGPDKVDGAVEAVRTGIGDAMLGVVEQTLILSTQHLHDLFHWV